MSDERVFVVPRSSVVGEAGWHGIRTDGLESFVTAVERDGRYEPRGLMERDPAFKQVIPYLILRDGERIFLMRRTAAGGDPRLHGRYSIGVGGHLNPGDGGVLGGLQREWAEELVADFVPEFRLIALLNDDTTAVGAVHVGAVYVADAVGRPVTVRETDKLSGSFVEPPEVAAVIDAMETWSRLAFMFLVGDGSDDGPGSFGRALVIRPVVAGALAAIASAVTLRAVVRRGGDRLLAAPRTMPDEAGLGPALDALGGEIVHLRSRDGLQLAARWLPVEPPAAVSDVSVDPWQPDPHDAILLLHGWSGSSAPDVVEYGPFLRRTAGVLGLDFGGHGGSDDAPTTFGLREVEAVAGALAWLGDRGIERVALVGFSMGGGTALAAVAVLGDGTLPSVDDDVAPPAHVAPPRRPRIIAVVADSVAPELAVPIASRLRGVGPLRRVIAEQLLVAAAQRLGADPRETEPRRVVGLLENTPLLIISGDADSTVPIEDARRLAAAAPSGTVHWIVAGAEHGGAHTMDPGGYEARVTEHLRAAFAFVHGPSPIIGAPGDRFTPTPDPAVRPDPANQVED